MSDQTPLPTGVTVITGMADGDRPHGFTIGSFTSVSLDPPLVGFLPQVDSETWALMADAGSFCVNVLSDKQSDLCWKFAKSGTEAERFDGVEWHGAPTGAPVHRARLVAWIDCEVEQRATRWATTTSCSGAWCTSLDADADHDGSDRNHLVFYRGTIGGFSAEG